MEINFFRGIKFVFLFLFISQFQWVYSFDETKSIDIRALSLGQMQSLSQGILNPAYLPFLKQVQFGASVFTRYEMNELNTRSIFGLIPNRLLNMSFHLSMFGYDDYQLIEGQAGFAKKLSSKFSIGTSVGYFIKNSILEEEEQTYLQADVSFLWRASDSFEWAFTTENFFHTRNSQPFSCFSGVRYHLASTFSVLLEAGFDPTNQFGVSAGIEYEIIKQLTIRGGFRDNPEMPSIGFAYKMEHWNIDTAFLFHPILGLSSGISVSYSF